MIQKKVLIATFSKTFRYEATSLNKFINFSDDFIIWQLDRAAAEQLDRAAAEQLDRAAAGQLNS